MKKRMNFWNSGMYQMQSNNQLQPTRYSAPTTGMP
jgi:hypothetical protein